jgi:predicted DNA-binding antitoxin AbrB/MazE fold protein
LDRLTAGTRPASSASPSWLWSYDKVGNRLVDQKADTSGVAASLSSYNTTNQLTSRAAGGSIAVACRASEAAGQSCVSYRGDQGLTRAWAVQSDGREIAMSIAIEAVWESGVLKPRTKLDLPESTNVRVIVEEAPSPSLNGWAAIDRLIGMVNDEGGPTDVAERHDEYLYGGLKTR